MHEFKGSEKFKPCDSGGGVNGGGELELFQKVGKVLKGVVV